MNEPTAGKLIIISGPSGAGKSTVVDRVLKTPHPFQLSISATTRLPRPGEEDGVNYIFLSAEEFRRRRKASEFLECKEVYGRDWYGTPRAPVASGLAEGKWVVLEIDVEGAKSVIQQMPDAITIFIHPGSMDELERRLRDRRTEAEDVIQRRLAVAAKEMDQRGDYQHEVINDEIDRAVAEICRIVAGETAPSNDIQ